MRAPVERYWKVLGEDNQSCHGGAFQWSLPRWDAKRGWIPGDWTPRIANLSPCERGYHVCRDGDLIHWLQARIYACEVRGQTVIAENKVVAESVRLTCPTPWDEVSARLFAVECASDALSLYESKYPTDSRVSDCLEVAFRFAIGEASEAERSAAWSAAWGAAESAARSAAWSAAWGAAWSAARGAAESAAESAAWSAAWGAAESAARSAAWSAAESAARSAAWSAARSAQTERLFWWLGARPAAQSPAQTATSKKGGKP